MQTLIVERDSLRLHVRGWGMDDARHKPVLILVHGFPDNSLVWEPLAALLQEDYRIFAYDVRGAGLSDAPLETAAYRLTELVGDLSAVIDAVSPGSAVHLAGHDWGSIQGWEAVTSPRLHGRIASFTSISGPSLDHAAFWIREGLRKAGSPEHTRKVLAQLLHSWYIASFHLPLIPRLTWRLAFDKWPQGIRRRFRQLGAEDFPTQSRDGCHGIHLYRANFIDKLLHPTGRWTDVPVQLIVPRDDRFVTPGLFDDLSGWAPRLWRRDVAAGHWVQRSHPELIAGYLREFTDYLEYGIPSPALRAARVGHQNAQA